MDQLLGWHQNQICGQGQGRGRGKGLGIFTQISWAFCMQAMDSCRPLTPEADSLVNFTGPQEIAYSGPYGEFTGSQVIERTKNQSKNREDLWIKL